MILAAIIWICTLAVCQCRIITIDNKGNNSTGCCTDGSCPCSSFIDALKHLKDDTTVNIISQLVTLDSNVTMGSGSLNNIRIRGNGAIVMCNNKGSVACRSCSNVIVEGITWDRCANSEFTQGIGFVNAVNVTLHNCTFQHFNTCIGVVFFNVSGFILVQRCQFLFNHLGNISDYAAYAALAILNNTDGDNIEVYIIETLFHHNGIFDRSERNYSTIHIILSKLSTILLDMDNSTISASGGLGGYFFLGNADEIVVSLNETIFTCNNRGGSEITIANVRPAPNVVLISFSTFAHNINGSLKLRLLTSSLFGGYSKVLLNHLTITGNKGTFGKDSYIGSNSFGQGTGILLWFASFTPHIKIAYCNIINNIGGDSSVVYIEDKTGSGYNVKIVSSNFTSNNGPTLYLSNCNIKFKGYSLFNNNTAQSGSAIYFAHNSQASFGDDSTIEFTNNVALLFGGAIYVDLPFNCPYQGITFTSLPYDSLVLFSNNSAGIAGNSLYFSIPESCNIIRNYAQDNSIVYIPYHFTYTQLPNSVIPEISTSPYAINLCSKECNTTKVNSCFIGKGDMLGQSINFNATACDYYNNISESVQFIAECINCNSSYRLSNNKILIHNGVSDFEVFAVNANSDISKYRNVTISMTSISSHGYKQLSAMISVELSPCHSGYIFDTNSQQCKCYDRDQDVIQCQEDYVEIKYGYWFGTVTSRIRTSSVCPTYYCEFDQQAETRNGYFNLPDEQDDQCSLHRTGKACGECKSGYTLAYDSPDCINENKCSTGITILVVMLTILYWIVVVVVVFGLMYFNINISLGYIYGIFFYYSIVDILLGSNLYISVGVFQLTTILSSFAKLTPQFLGKLCFVQGLSGIDQQFIHYAHALAVFLLTIGIFIIARSWSNKIASIVSHCIIRVVCLLLLLAYTSLASTSFQLLRPLYYYDINGVYVYLSPSIKYFTNRHVAYGIIAWACGLFLVIGFPLLLFFQPFLRSKVNFIKIKPLLDQFQGCYKDQYHYFAAYYLICRLIIIAIAFVNNALYYLQTASIIVVMIHIWIRPYKSDTLNMLDGIILSTMILIINLGSYTFITSTTTTLVILFVVFPLCLSLVIFFYFSFLSKWINHIKNSRINEARYAIDGV